MPSLRPDLALAALIKLAETPPEIRAPAAPFVLPAPFLRQLEDLQRVIADTDLLELEEARDLAESETATAYRRDETDFADALTTLVEFVDRVLDVAPPPSGEDEEE